MQVDLHEANRKLQAGAAKTGTDTTQERRHLEEQRRQLEDQRRQTEERVKSVDQKARTLEEKERALQSLDQDLKKRKAKMDQLEQQLQRVGAPVHRVQERTSEYVLHLSVFVERWIAGQKIGGNAEGSRNSREGIGKSERGDNQELCRNREATAAHANDSGGAKRQGEANQRTARVSISQLRHLND